jgi:hypothetical protein
MTSHVEIYSRLTTSSANDERSRRLKPLQSCLDSNFLQDSRQPTHPPDLVVGEGELVDNNNQVKIKLQQRKNRRNRRR